MKVNSRLTLMTLILVVYYLLPVTVQAADSSPSAIIRSKLRALQDEVASRAAKLKVEVAKSLQNKFYVGVIDQKSSKSWIIITNSGQKNIVIGDDVDYRGKSFIIGNAIAALGDVDETGVLTAKRIVKLAQNPNLQLEVLHGEVLSKDNSLLQIKLAGGQTASVSANLQTRYKMGRDDASFDDIKLNKIISVVSVKSTKDLKARFIYITPYSARSKIPKVSSASARISTPSSVKK